MSPEPVVGPSSLVNRIKSILLTPKAEWPRIAAEPATVGGIYTSYVVILAAIPAVAGLIGALVFGYGAFGFSYQPSFIGAISGAVTQYVLSLVMVYVLALIINALAPQFGGTKDQTQAFKVAAYSATASWLAGITALVPALSILGLLGLYSLYLLYTGIPVLMRAPQEKALPYTVITIIVAIALSLLVTAITAPVAGVFGGRGTPDISVADGGTVTVPGVGTVDLSKMEEATQRMQDAAEKAEAGGAAETLPPADLQAMLPVGIGAYTRTEVESQSMSAGGMGGANASGRYTSGDLSFRLEVTDMAAVGAMAGLSSALKIQSNKETATGYEKIGTVDGRMVTERWDRADKDGTYSVIVGNRFMVSAEGQVESIDDLKAAVEAVGITKLEALAK